MTDDLSVDNFLVLSLQYLYFCQTLASLIACKCPSPNIVPINTCAKVQSVALLCLQN